MAYPQPGDKQQAHKLNEEYERIKISRIEDLLKKGDIKAKSIRDLLTESIRPDIESENKP